MEYIYPALATYCGDLQELYRVARRKRANYENLNAACNNCNIAGSNLDSINGHFLVLDVSETDQFIDSTLDAIQNGSIHEAAEAKGSWQVCLCL